MSISPWQDRLRQTIARIQKSNQSPRIAVLGIGHELRRDDAAGVVLARRLQCLVEGDDDMLVIDAGPAPENYGGLLRRFGPNLVLLVDAALVDATPGTVRWLNWQNTSGLSSSTHTLPLRIWARYLAAELGCDVALLGIQPADVSFGASLSPEVERTIMVVAQVIGELRAATKLMLWKGIECHG